MKHLQEHFYCKIFICNQGLIRKEKVHIECEKGAQISILANKIGTMMNQYNEGVQTNYVLYLFFVFSLLCPHYVADLTEKLELRLMVVSVLPKY